MTEDIIIPDKNFHIIAGRSYPRVTAITGCWPKGEQFERWLADQGSYSAAEEARDAAGESGSKVHAAIVELIAGKELQYGYFTVAEWRKLESFCNFWKDFAPIPVAVEAELISEKMDTAGHCDLIAEIGKKIVLIDWKSGKTLQYCHEIQVNAYASIFEETTKKKVDELWLVRLGSRHKSGYELKVVKESRKKLLDSWKVCRKIWEKEFGNDPRVTRLRGSLKL